MRIHPLIFLFGAIILTGCSNDKKRSTLHDVLAPYQGLKGKPDYLNTPFVAAGDKLYLVGHQNGSFPDLGWHIAGEMGGIWNHPIKLMDGFTMGINNGETYWCLDEATSFTNFPFGNLHEYQLGERLKVTRFQFVPDGENGMIVEYRIENNSYLDQVLNIDFSGLVDLRPTWLSERQGVEDGVDEITWEEKPEAFVGRDPSNSWYVFFGADRRDQISIGIDTRCDAPRKGNGQKAMISSQIELKKGEISTLQFYIAGSHQSWEKARETFELLKENATDLLQTKIARYDSIRALVDITVPDQEIQELYTWMKYTTDWLIRDVDGMGRGLSAGIPDYPWWFGADNCYSLQGLLATGQHEEVISTMNLLVKLSTSVNGTGRIMHEASTNGEVYNPGNLNETPHFIYLIWKMYQWTGDRSYLESLYPLVKNGLQWISDQDKDRNGYPDGPGMMEIQGLHTEMIDVVVYTQQAFQAGASIARALNDPTTAALYQKKADDLKLKVNQDWWVEASSSYADFRSTKPQALALIDEAIVRADTLKKPWAVTELTTLKNTLIRTPQPYTSGYVAHHNWVVNTPMEMGIADGEKALRALETATAYRNRFGMFVTGLDRDENQEESAKWTSFSYVGAVMTIPTGVQAVAEARYGRPNESLRYLQMLRESFGYALPGSMYEVSPDYGMIAQAWNIYAVAVPIVEYYFGIKPDAPNKTVTIEPLLPEYWQQVGIQQVRVGENYISYLREPMGERVRYTVTQKQDGWTIRLKPDPGSQILVNKDQAKLVSGYVILIAKENVVEIVY